MPTAGECTPLACDMDPLPISLIAHTVFCPRRAWLEANGEAVDSPAIHIGIDAHEHVDDPGRSRRETRRAVEVESALHGFRGRCDTVATNADGTLEIIELKTAPIRRRPEVPEQTRVQVALQAIALAEQGNAVSAAFVYFPAHRAHVAVGVAKQDLAEALAWVDATRNVVRSAAAPHPLIDDPRCAHCSHVGVCLPDENRATPRPRAISVSDPDKQILYLTTPGSRANLRAGAVIVSTHSGTLAKIPLERIQALMIHGNVDVTSAVIRECLARRAPIIWSTWSGRLVGWAGPWQPPNGSSRTSQHCASAAGRIDIARQVVSAKIANQATQLRRAGVDGHVESLRNLSRTALRQHCLDDLLGTEGQAAALYFGDFASMLTQSAQELGGLGKRGRQADDPINALLNYAYSLLLADAIKAILACGLDPCPGFLHSNARNKPALALDLMEEFRAPVADSVVLKLVNTAQIRKAHFHDRLGAVQLRPDARRTLINAYELRMATSFKHPIFKYQVTWRRAVEVQARLILSVLDGTRPEYRGIRTR